MSEGLLDELQGNLTCIPLVLSSSLQNPEQSIAHCSSETSDAPSVSDMWLIISRMSLFLCLCIVVDETFKKLCPGSICFILFLIIT